MSHEFCRTFLALTRKEGKNIGVIPKKITAMRVDKDWFFVEADNIDGRSIQAECCAYEAKAKFIHQQLRVEELEQPTVLFKYENSGPGGVIATISEFQDY